MIEFANLRAALAWAKAYATGAVSVVIAGKPANLAQVPPQVWQRLNK